MLSYRKGDQPGEDCYQFTRLPLLDSLSFNWQETGGGDRNEWNRLRLTVEMQTDTSTYKIIRSE